MLSSEEIKSDESCIGTPVLGTRCASDNIDDVQVIRVPKNIVEPRRISFGSNAGSDDRGTMVLRSGLIRQSGPLGNHSNSRIQHHSLTKGRTATIVDMDEE